GFGLFQVGIEATERAIGLDELLQARPLTGDALQARRIRQGLGMAQLGGQALESALDLFQLVDHVKSRSRLMPGLEKQRKGAPAPCRIADRGGRWAVEREIGPPLIEPAPTVRVSGPAPPR